MREMQTASLVPAAPCPTYPSAFSMPMLALDCAGMRILSRDVRAGTELAAPGDRIELQVPMAQARLRASLADAEGHRVEAVLAPPQTALVPAGTRSLLRVERGGALVTFSLEPARWHGVAHAALGHERQIREPALGPDSFVSGIAELLHHSSRAQRLHDRAWLEAIAQDVMVHLATRYARPPEASMYAGLAPHRLQRVLAVIEERLAEPLQVHDLAEAVHMSPYHFARMFKQSTGQPPHLYITWQRMDRAKELLARSSLRLAEVATRVGYQTQAHFTGVFHGRVGLTPRAYRLRCANAGAARASRRSAVATARS